MKNKIKGQLAKKERDHASSEPAIVPQIESPGREEERREDGTRQGKGDAGHKIKLKGRDNKILIQTGWAL